MTAAFKRFLSAALALLMLLALPLGSLAQELPAADGETEPDAGLLEITVPDYTPGADLQLGDVNEVQKGGRYTLIVLPARAAAQGGRPKALTATLLLDSDPLFIGSAIADADGHVTFTGIRLRSAEAAVYYVTGPGLTTPLAEATSLSVMVSGKVLSGQTGVENATVSVVDSTTGYAYANTAQTISNGNYTFSDIAPGVYDFWVNKPGYLPAAIRKGVVISDDASTVLTTFNYASYIGDLNNDGNRDLADLTDFLTYYHSGLDLPASLTLDLNEDSAIDQADLSLFLTAAGMGGTGVPSGSTALVAQDTGSASQTDRTLAFSLHNGGVRNLTFTAAHISLTFRSDYVQPINQNGGVIYPTSASTTANCLVPKSGVTLSNIRWTLNGDLTTLDFSVSCAKPTALTGLVDFRYRPAPGKTVSDFFDGVFTVSHAAAQVGSSGLLEDCALTYPGSQPQDLTGLTISASPSTVTIPTSGRTSVASLSVTGAHEGEDVGVVKGISWSMTGDTTGVSISDDLLTVSSAAKPGVILLTASKNGVTSDPYTITLENAPSVPTSIVLYGGGPNGSIDQPITQFTHVVDDSLPAAHIYLAAAVLDQYGAVMTDQIVTWSLSGAPAAIRVDPPSGSSVEVVVDGHTLSTGSYDFSLHAACGSLQASCAITVQRIWPLNRLTISGPSTAQIPAAGAGTLTLRYAISAIDGSGASMSTSDLSLRFTVDGAPDGVTSDCSINGDCTVTVDSSAQAGALTLRATDGDGTVSATFTLTLKPAPDQSAVSDPVRAAIAYDGILTEEQSFSFDYNSTHTLSFQGRLLNQDGDPIAQEGTSWNWTSSGAPTGVSVSQSADNSAYGQLKLNGSTPLGTYHFTLTASEATTGLAFTIPIHLTIVPVLGSLTFAAPNQVLIPASGSASYTIPLNAADAQGDPMPLPSGIAWSMSPTSPAGVTLKSGVLTVTSSAVPGELQITASCGDVEATTTLTLISASSSKVLALRRSGELLSGGVDAAYGKEGSDIKLSYEPVLVDQSNGTVEALSSSQVTWVGAQGSFTVDKNAEPGTYSAPITAIYDGQSVSLTAQITVYPDITAIYADFGADDANSAVNAYRFTVPATASRTYRGTVMATIRRGGKTLNVPLSSLTLPEYDLEFYTFLTGVYLAYDYATGQVSLTIDPIASTNSMDPPEAGDPDSRYVGVEFSYYPGQKPFAQSQSFMLTPEPLKLTSAILRQGAGSGSKFVFESAQETAAIESSPGVLSHCYALELLDQYGNPITDQYVAWTLTGAPNGSTDDPLISMIDPGEAISNNYPRYQSLRRLRIDPEAQAGVYHLTLTAACGPTADAAKNDPTFTRSIAITLTVSGVWRLQNATLTGPTSSLIPMWYSSYNHPATINNEVRTATYVAAAQGPGGGEVDPALCSFDWTVTTHDGQTPTGVTIAPSEKNPAVATVTVTRHASPTAKDAPLLVGVTVTPKGGDSSSGSSASLDLTLNRSSLVPALLTIQGGPTSFTLGEEDAQATGSYTFTMVDQYNNPAPDQDCKSVKWSLPRDSSFVTKTDTTDANGYPAVRLTVTNKGVATRGTIILRAAVTFTNALSESGQTTVYQDLSIPYVIGNPPIGGGDLGGDILPPEEEVVADLTVTPSTNKSGTTGTVTLSTTEISNITKNTSIGTLTIAPKNTAGLTSITINLPSSMLYVAAPDQAGVYSTRLQTLQIQTAIGTLTFPQRALQSFSTSGASSVTILNQDNRLAVTFLDSLGHQLSSLSSPVTFTAPVKGNIVTMKKGGVSLNLTQQNAISNGVLTVSLTGSGELRVGTKTQSKVFSDTYNHWAKEAVDFVVERDLFQGTSETTFSPAGDMTRGMVVTVLHRLEDLPAPASANSFSDVPNGTWYTDGVVWASEQGIVQGNGDNCFLPNAPVTREQLVTILYRYVDKLGLATNRRSSLTPFSDSAQVSPWAKDAMEWAVAAGLISGKPGGLLDPGGKASRAEVATIIQRLVQLISPSV